MTKKPAKDNEKKGVDRRRFLKYTGIIAVSSTVAGCLGGGGGGDGGSGNGSGNGGGNGGGGNGGGGNGGNGGTSKLTFQDEGFEDKDMSEWNIKEEAFKRTTVAAHSGKFSAGIKAGGVKEIATANITPGSGGAQISRLEYYWWETGGGKGGGTRFLNSDGDVEIGVGSGNPDWRVDDQTGLSRQLGDAGYKKWVQTVLSFDWKNGFVNISLQDPKNKDNKYTNDHPLKVGKDIKTIQLHGFDGSKWEGGIDMNWDDFKIEM